ncbi:MAG: PilZ domain-containing protein [Hyphomicrobiaceae bacterium]|jgi:hypothetical protein
MAQSNSERRQWPRLKANSKGEIVYMRSALRGLCSLPCRVVDVSDGGAQVEMADVKLPDEVYLVIDETVKIACRVMRQEGPQVGLHFI